MRREREREREREEVWRQNKHRKNFADFFLKSFLGRKTNSFCLSSMNFFVKFKKFLRQPKNLFHRIQYFAFATCRKIFQNLK